MDISICILNRNQKALLEKCLASCVQELERSKVSGEIILVDNASDDGSREMVAQLFPAVRVIQNSENQSFSSANNHAITMSSGRYAFILNNDTILLSGSLRIMVDFLEAHPQVAAVGPKLLNLDGSVQQGYHRSFPHLAEPLLLLFGLNRVWPGRVLFDRFKRIDETLIEPTPIEQVGGCALLLRRAALDSAGLFDEGFHYWFEDVELCHRIAKQGWAIYYLPQAQIIHYGGATFATTPIPEQLMLYISGVLLYFKKQRGLTHFVVLRAMVTLAVLFRLALTGLLSIVPSARARRRWSGKPAIYWRMLHVILWNHSVPSRFDTA